MFDAVYIVMGTSNNANGNILCYYADNGFTIQTFNFNACSDAAHVTGADSNFLGLFPKTVKYQ